MKTLIVDDEKIKRTALQDDLVDAGHVAKGAACAADGLKRLNAEQFDVVVTDLRMKGMDGIAFLKEIKQKWPETEVIMISAYATVDNAVQAMKLGAFDYITKPFESDKLLLVLDKIAKMRALETENVALRAELARVTRYGEIVSNSKAMSTVLELLNTAINSDVPVLLWGETGTGKELLATAIHNGSARKDNPFIRISCAALSEQLMESELFGHERGAFTDAVESKQGRFELADKGTLFLDEIDDVPLNMQVKMLRVLDGNPFERVGGVTSIQTDVRVVAASKVDLRENVTKGTFRSDLFYRLNAFPIWIPPLRGRREDIPLLVQYFADLYSKTTPAPQISEEAMSILWDYAWPGNVRELQNVVRRILLGIGDGTVVKRQDVPADIRLASMEQPSLDAEPKSFSEAIAAKEKLMLAKALDAAGGNQSRAASALEMKLSTFRDKLAKYGIVFHSPNNPGD